MLPPGWTSYSLNHHATCPTPPCQPVLPFTETVPYLSSLLLLYVAMCLGASAAVRDSATPIVLHKSTSCSPSQRANVQRQDDMAICSHPSVSPFQRDSPPLQLWCDWGLLSQQRACLSGLIPDILTLYQHNWGSCQVGHWITFHWCVRPDWSTASRAYWPKRGLYSWETQALSLPCHISNCRAEKKGRVLHHVPYTQAVLTLARKKSVVFSDISLSYVLTII